MHYCVYLINEQSTHKQSGKFGRSPICSCHQVAAAIEVQDSEALHLHYLNICRYSSIARHSYLHYDKYRDTQGCPRLSSLCAHRLELQLCVQCCIEIRDIAALEEDSEARLLDQLRRKPSSIRIRRLHHSSLAVPKGAFKRVNVASTQKQQWRRLSKAKAAATAPAPAAVLV